MDSSNFLDIRSSESGIVISGRTDLVKRNRLAMMYLRDNCDFEFIDQEIHVAVSEDLHTVLDDVKVVAEYAGCELLFTDEVEDEIKEYQEEEDAFEEFSRRAKDIRDNHPIIAEFESFEKTLKQVMTRQLYQQQLLAAYHLCFSQNGCNFSVPGAGKTSVVYGAYAYLHNLPSDDRRHVDGLLIIGPLSSFGPWELEYKACFDRPVKSTRLIGGMSRDAKENYLYGDEHTELNLTSYQSVPSIEEALKHFIRRNRLMVVLDEAHKIKNTDGGIQATAVMGLADYASSRVVLTGTPAPNGYEDLYNLFKFIWPKKDVMRFGKAQLKSMSRTVDDGRVSSLMDNIAPYFIRVKKSDLNIPPAQTIVVPVEMTVRQRDIYDMLERRYIASAQEAITSSIITDMQRAKTVRLMQAATNPALLRDPIANFIDGEGFMGFESSDDRLFLDKVLSFYGNEVPAKYIKAGEICKQIIDDGGKVVIWATFVKNIHLLRSYLESLGFSVKELYGATPVSVDDSEDDLETREKIVNEFNDPSSNSRIIIANPFAVAESISLHKACHNAIYLERSFNAAHFMQSKDRIHRYGLKPGTVTTYYHLLSRDSIDETIEARLNLKEQRMLEIIESMPIPLFDNTIEGEGLDDIKALIRDYESRAEKS